MPCKNNSPQRILSIQSHVVSGYVGNKAAVFPLQLLGFDVDVINSVHFSNHTGYPQGVKGDVLNGSQLLEILEGLEQNSLLNNVEHILTGFIGSQSFLKAVLTLVKRLRLVNSDIRFVCDPVLGDRGKFYVPPELVQVYKEQVLPVANVVTPNQFEVEQLTGIVVNTQEDALAACKALHDMGPELVFITSMVLQQDNRSTDSTKTIAIMASQRTTSCGDEVWRIDAPLLDGDYTGTGDLCAALLLGHTTNASLPEALEKVIGTMSAVIARTAKSRGDSVSSCELQLIQSKKDIEQPPPPPLGKAYRLT